MVDSDARRLGTVDIEQTKSGLDREDETAVAAWRDSSHALVEIPGLDDRRPRPIYGRLMDLALCDVDEDEALERRVPDRAFAQCASAVDQQFSCEGFGHASGDQFDRSSQIDFGWADEYIDKT
jgi:hypothetical protein